MVQSDNQSKKKFRPEIEGLRAVAALLVAIYHIWLGRVSGGVDVFFVVSGFLITASLLSKYRRFGTVNFFEFIMGLLKRLMPQAFFVLLSVIIFSYFYLPGARWMLTIKEIFASALYYENWQLALTAVDYLDATNEKSPVQHFWAMSIQGQFYIIWFAVIWCAILLSRVFKQSIKKVLMILLLLLFTLSLAYSVHLTDINQPWAYFDTRTRVWEFALGGMLCIFIHRMKLKAPLSFMIGWIGLIMLILCGILLDVSSLFPGYIALWPTLSAVLILLSGENATKYGVERLLGTKWMMKLGGYSYGFYLWHWVLLTFYHILFKKNSVSIMHGMLIIVCSLILSIAVTQIIEKPIRSLKVKNNSWPVVAVICLCMFPVLVSNSLWLHHMNGEMKKIETLAKSKEYPGAGVFEMDNFEELAYIPDDANIKEDQAQPYKDGCHVKADDPKVKICEYGVTKNFDYTVAVVGGSHSTHWFTAIEDLAQKYKIRVLNVTKSGCRLSTDKNGLPSCDKWNEQVVEKVSAQNPDIVLAMAEISYFNVEDVPQGYIDQFNAFSNHGIEIFAIRDTPYFRTDVPECIQAEGRHSEKCKIRKDLVVPKQTDWSKLKNKPPGVHFVDYTDKICPDTFCEPVVGNVVAYFDKSHMTKTFVSTLTPYVEKDLIPILKKIKEQKENIKEE
ncbi:acyltransferase family protein [Macrococcus equi]|uniref:acyltransferase family protein n=1 Tax=Macrococcus equi TaxID=3395462 RepID=UPI0039BDC370